MPKIAHARIFEIWLNVLLTEFNFTLCKTPTYPIFQLTQLFLLPEQVSHVHLCHLPKHVKHLCRLPKCATWAARRYVKHFCRCSFGAHTSARTRAYFFSLAEIETFLSRNICRGWQKRLKMHTLFGILCGATYGPGHT